MLDNDLSQLHKQFISPISLAQFNWYCESGSDNDKALTGGRDLTEPLFSRVYRRSLFFFLALCARSRSYSFASLGCLPFSRKERKEK